MNTRKDLSAELHRRSNAASGKKYWRTLEELAETAPFQELMRREFPEQADVWPDSLSRRQFLTLMGASLALAGLSGCSVRPAPSINLVPYVKAPEEVIPGKPLFFATTMTLGGAGVGLLVESHLGRPTKIEGNPDHPASLGATDIYHQASVLGLYDPDRSQTVTYLGKTQTWDDALNAIRGAIDKQRGKKGAGVRLLTETVVSPTLGSQIQNFLKAFPGAKWHQYEPINRDAAFRASQTAFGEPVSVHYDFRKADVVLSLEADFLASGPGNLRHVVDFMSRRRVREQTPNAAEMNRLYIVESGVSTTGAKADHRLALRSSQVEGLARALARQLELNVSRDGKNHESWIAAVAKDLEQHRGRCLIVPGERQPASVHLLAHALNEELGNVGQTVLYTKPIEVRPTDQTESLRDLVQDLESDGVEILIILGGNPVFTAPVDFQFKAAMQKAPLRVHLSLYQDETSRQCHWHLPEAHYLEAWSDSRAFDGTASIAQPLIEPLYQGRSALEVVAALTDPVSKPGYELVRNYWRQQWGNNQFDERWQTAVHDGVISGSEYEPKTLRLKGGWEKHLPDAATEQEGYELTFQPDPTIFDGRFANNGWLQELPKPITTLTWDNSALMSPKTAKELGISLGSYAHGGEHGGFYMPVVEIKLGDKSIQVPAWIVPGHADGSISISLGYGRDFAGKVGGGVQQGKVGANAYPLRTSESPWFVSGVGIRKTNETYLLACTQQHQLMENRDCVRTGSLKDFREKPQFASESERKKEDELTLRARKPLNLYEPYPYREHKWGMVIDLTACTGCKSCVVACQAENNIPVVGKDQVAAGREMHWLRIDHYSTGAYDSPREHYFQPIPCMHCENAPCEYVCPVAATVHSAEGLNDMVYQRCVGTRFCSNNCPYKVRRFNFLAYADFETQSLRLQYNPDVTVRSRGVMEKCSYCIQRIRHAEIESQIQDRPLVDGEILTACQSACPANAIIFGDMNDPASRVKKLKESPLHYGLLEDLNTVPRTTYLAALRNPNPELEAE
jgi:molybdopterin-containing oxidoreductase family iron-sulfur binding subunit